MDRRRCFGTDEATGTLESGRDGKRELGLRVGPGASDVDRRKTKRPERETRKDRREFDSVWVGIRRSEIIRRDLSPSSPSSDF